MQFGVVVDARCDRFAKTAERLRGRQRVLLAVGRQFRYVLVVEVLREGHVGDVIVEIVVFDEVGRATLLLLAVSLSKCIFLRRRVPILPHRDHDHDEDEY